MRIAFILIASILGAGGLFATMKVPNTRGTERLLQAYDTRPEETLKNIEMAMFECIPGSSKSTLGLRLTGKLMAPLYVKISALRMEGTEKDAFKTHIQKWMIANHPKLLKELSDRDYLELTGYIKKVGDDDVENCIISSTLAKAENNPAAKNWQLRL